MKTLIKTLFVIAILAVNNPVISQDFSNNDIRIINRAIDSLLNLYATYSTFTEDDLEISADYQKHFEELFEPGALVYVDYIPDVKEPASVKRYSSKVNGRFKEGLGVNVTDVSLEKPQKLKNEKGNEIKVKFTKDVFGFRHGKKEEKIVPLIMTVHFNNVNGSCKVTSIYDIEQEIRSVNQKKTNEVSLNIIPAYSFIKVRNDSIQNLTSKGGFSVQFNLTFSKYFKIKENIYYGIGLGLGMSNYTTTVSFNHYIQPESDHSIVDQDSDSLKYLVNFGNTNDQINITFLDVIIWPVRLRHFSINTNLEYFVNFGLKFSNPYNSQSILSGNDTTSGAYYKLPGTSKLLLDDVGYYGYGPRDFTDAEGNMSLSDLLVMGIVNAGMSLTFGKSFVASVALNFDFSFSNLNKQSSPFLAYRKNKENKNEYNSIITVTESSKPISAGMMFGLSYHF